MKKFNFISCVTVLIFGVLIGGFFGAEIKKNKNRRYIEADATEKLALDLEIFKQLDAGNLKEGKWMLQTSSVGELHKIIEYADFNDNSRRFRCAVLTGYEKYYKDNHLFSSEDWGAILGVDGMAEAARRREEFFEKTLPNVCGKLQQKSE